MTTADRVRERKICEVVGRVLATSLSAARSGGFSPEDPPRRSQYADNERVEWVASIGSQKFAIEVTQVQAMGERIAAAKQLEQLCKPIAQKLQGELPVPGIYDLVIQPGALSDIRNKQLPAVRKCLLAWVRDVAPTLGTKASTHFARETPAGCGFEVTLYRFRTRRNHGNLRWAYAMPENLEQEQRAPVCKALQDKLPKLLCWRAKGAAAVLAIETRDIALSDEHRVAEIFVSKLRSRGVDLDRLFIINTAFRQWPVYAVRSTGQGDQTCIEEVGNFDESEMSEVAPSV